MTADNISAAAAAVASPPPIPPTTFQPSPNLPVSPPDVAPVVTSAQVGLDLPPPADSVVKTDSLSTAATVPLPDENSCSSAVHVTAGSACQGSANNPSVLNLSKSNLNIFGEELIKCWMPRQVTRDT